MGSVLLFPSGATMIATRRLDWYRLGATLAPTPPTDMARLPCRPPAGRREPAPRQGRLALRRFRPLAAWAAVGGPPCPGLEPEATSARWSI